MSLPSNDVCLSMLKKDVVKITFFLSARRSLWLTKSNSTFQKLMLFYVNENEIKNTK